MDLRGGLVCLCVSALYPSGAYAQLQARTALPRQVPAGHARLGAVSGKPSRVALLIAIPELSFTDAFFETMSGSTLRATVLVGLEHLPPSINMWRAALHWYGSAVIVLVVLITPAAGRGRRTAAGRNRRSPVKNETHAPRITGGQGAVVHLRS